MNQGLKAEIREKTGSKLAAKERTGGKLPAIVYGHKQEAVAVLLDEHDFLNELHHGHRLIDLEVGKAKEIIPRPIRPFPLDSCILPTTESSFHGRLLLYLAEERAPPTAYSVLRPYGIVLCVHSTLPGNRRAISGRFSA